MENSGKQNPKMGFKSPPVQRENRARHSLQEFLRLFDRFRGQKSAFSYSRPGSLPRENLENLNLSEEYRVSL
jgi:hypothetical protein